MGAAEGELLHAMVAAIGQRIQDFGPFEVIGFLDSAALLQSQAAQDSLLELPPSGVGEIALRAALTRLTVLVPSLEDEELQVCKALLQSMVLPSGTGILPM